MAIATKRGLKRKDLIQRIKVLEYALSNSIQRQRNCELILDYYIEMNGDDEKFQKFLDKKAEDAESSEPKSK